MKITRNNCEAFFLDYYEGNLSEGQVAELFAFLKSNPDLRDVFESFSEVTLDEEKYSSPDFSFLKKDSVADIHEVAQKWMVDSVDGTISEEDKTALENYLTEYPAKRVELSAFEKTILSADHNETLGDLNSLKKDTAITPENFEYYAIASVEGTISSNEKSLLESFVNANPEYKTQLDAFRSTVLNADASVSFEAKADLKKTSFVVTEANIEELLVGKMEGELAAHVEAAVDAYIIAHPQYKQDLELLSKTRLVADETETFSAKGALKKGVATISEENIEEYLFSASEGLLNGEELKALNAFVAKYPKYRNALAAYQAAHVQADMSVVYDDKEGLKRKEKGGILWFSSGIRYAAAAILVLVFGIYLWTKIGNDDTTPQNNIIANVDTLNSKSTPDQNILPSNNQPQLANNDVPQSNSYQTQNNQRGNEYHGNLVKDNGANGNPAQPIEFVTTAPVTIVANYIPNRGNDAVTFSDALFNVIFDNNAQAPVAKVTPADEYISPGQLAMRWMKDKIDGPDAAPNSEYENWSALNGDSQKSANGNVTGTDLAESAINRVGQNAADGNVALQQRNDGTYLHLWDYEIRVAK